MDKNLKRKYYGFICKFISEKKICLTTKIEKRYTEQFFSDAKNDGILLEIEHNDDGNRQFTFTKKAREFLD